MIQASHRGMMMRSSMRSGFLTGALALFVAGCGGGLTNADDGSSKVANLIAFGSTTAPPIARDPTIDDDIVCPSVDLLEGASSIRIGGADASSVRAQVSISDVARECTPTPGGGYLLKIGVEGRALIGPAGSPGRYDAPVRFVVKQGERVLVSRLQRQSVTVASGPSSFTAVESGIAIPKTNDEITILVGLDPGGRAAAGENRRRR